MSFELLCAKIGSRLWASDYGEGLKLHVLTLLRRTPLTRLSPAGLPVIPLTIYDVLPVREGKKLSNKNTVLLKIFATHHCSAQHYSQVTPVSSTLTI